MKLRLPLTPEEALPAARCAARWLKSIRRVPFVTERAPWSEAPYRTTLVSKTTNPVILIEAQGTLSYHNALSAFSQWIIAGRKHAELYIAVENDAQLAAEALHHLRRDGVGLLTCNDDGVTTVSLIARSPALSVYPDPTLRFGDCASDVSQALAKFNDSDRKDGLRDMCEIVERETSRVMDAAHRKGLLSLTAAAIAAMNWSDRINSLTSARSYSVGQAPVFDDAFKNDLHSFRGARNLVDHPPKNARDHSKRVRQFSERMAQGPRLVAELVSLRRRILRKP